MSTAKAKLDPLIYEFDSLEEEESYNAWLRAKVQRAIADPRPPVPHDQVIAELDAIIERASSKKANA